MRRVIVCGAGSAGCVLAARLSEDAETSVVLLEAGPDYPSVEQMPQDVRSAWVFGVTDHDWGYVSDDHIAATDQQPNWAHVGSGAIQAFRGKVIGGSSSTNASNALRAPRQDFDRWVGLGNDRWSWNDVLPVFRAMEDDPAGGERHGTGGPVPIRRFSGDSLRPFFGAFIAACGTAGYPVVDDLNGTDRGGAAALPVNQVDGVRQSTAICYLMEARRRPNLEIRPEVMVDRLELVDGHARAVLLDTGERIEGDVIVLSAGALSSPAILMRSGVGPAGLLAQLGIEVVKELAAVGQGLRDHPMVYPIWSLKKSAGDPTPPLQAALAFSSTGPGQRGEIDLHLIPFTPSPDQFVAGVGLVRPYSIGEIEIRSADPATAPRIMFNVLQHPEDLERLVRGVELAREIVRHEPLASYVGDEIWPGPSAVTHADVVAAVLGAKNTYAHATSTCAMGPEGAPWAVVDQGGAVHGLNDLYVIDASIFPTIPAVPTNMTTIMVAERCAAVLRVRLSEATATASAAR